MIKRGQMSVLLIQYLLEMITIVRTLLGNIVVFRLKRSEIMMHL